MATTLPAGRIDKGYHIGNSMLHPRFAALQLRIRLVACPNPATLAHTEATLSSSASGSSEVQYQFQRILAKSMFCKIRQVHACRRKRVFWLSCSQCLALRYCVDYSAATDFATRSWITCRKVLVTLHRHDPTPVAILNYTVPAHAATLMFTDHCQALMQSVAQPIAM